MAGRGAKDPRKTLTPAQRMRQSIKRKAEEAGATETTPQGGYGAILSLIPGAGRAVGALTKTAKTAKTAKKAKATQKSAREKLEEKGRESAGGKADDLMAQEVAKKQNIYPNVPKSASQKKVAAARKGMEQEEKIKKTIGAGAATAAAAGAASSNFSKKDIPTPKRKPSVAPSKNIPVGKREGEAFKGLETAEPKARQTPSMRASMPEKNESSLGSGSSSSKSSDGETIGEYFSNLEGRKTKVKTPFGTIDVDSSDAAYSDVNGMNDKFSGSYKGGRPGMKKNAVRRNAGGKVSMGRGMGKALRGGGKVMK
jgi:hypothetical protein